MVNFTSLEIIWDRKALDNFKEILGFLEKRSSVAPIIVKNSILSKIETIKIDPFACEVDKLKDSSNKEFIAFVIFGYRVTFQFKSEANEIRILRIRHTSREPLGY